jgi:hypothetical protein
MTRNNEDLFYHMAHRENRESISQAGLVPHKPWEDMPKGVYVMPGYPNTAYGDDIYEITPSKRTEFHRDPMDPGAMYSRRTIRHSDFKRVGHVFNDNGGAEVHWHPEEECGGRINSPDPRGRYIETDAGR